MDLRPANQAELQRIREDCSEEMRIAQAHAYVMTNPAWRTAFVDFPLGVDVSHAWVGHWARDASSLYTPADLTIASAPHHERRELRERMRAAPLANAVPSGISVHFRGAHQAVTAQLLRTDTGLHVAEIIDGPACVIVTTSRATLLPTTIHIESLEDREPAIQGWREIWDLH